MAARKTTSRKAGAPKRARALTAFQRFEAELPADLRSYTRRVRKGLTRLERQIEEAQKDARRRWARLLRDVSHQLGSVEAAGEKRWRQRTLKARREAVKALHRLERAIEPPKRKKKVQRKKVQRKKAAARKPAAAKAAVRPIAAQDLPAVVREEPAPVARSLPPPPPL